MRVLGSPGIMVVSTIVAVNNIEVEFQGEKIRLQYPRQGNDAFYLWLVSPVKLNTEIKPPGTPRIIISGPTR